MVDKPSIKFNYHISIFLYQNEMELIIMGLTNKSTGINVDSSKLKIDKVTPQDKVIALAGNPNVGKSTVFNELTGLNQHTGNWPGKTVTNAQGKYTYNNKNFILVDLPGTYSILSSSVEEEIARDFICFDSPDSIVVVTDATCLERNLNLVLQILEINQNVVVCVNLLDEARKKKMKIDLDELSLYLGVPVIGTSARSREGLDELIEAIDKVSFKETKTYFSPTKYDDIIDKSINILEPIVKDIVKDKLDSRWLSIKLLDIDESLKTSLKNYLGFDILENNEILTALDKIYNMLSQENITKETIRDKIVFKIISRSEEIYKKCVFIENSQYNSKDRKLDKILTSKSTGVPVMILLFGLIFWITIAGANYPSDLLALGLFWFQDKLYEFFNYINMPLWINNMIVLGVYRTVAWVVSVMLPPMAIFFPLFTLLEDSGYLPRIAFNMDKYFKKACAHGKQALTMAMGFGCNACGVIGCRIIDSKRERLIAILTNNFVPCNGRFPTLISIITMFFIGSVISPIQSLFSAVILTLVIVLGVIMTLLVSKLLSKTILKGMPSSFVLELPPYRRPQIGKVIVRSLLDRALFVLGRAVMVAAPAGLIIFLMSNITIGDMSILKHCTSFLDPFAKLLGLDGVILMAFILGFPANEIVIPIIIMSYMCTGSIMELDNLESLRTLLVDNGWTFTTAICTMLFCLFHFPCGTTCFTIKKETESIKWTLVSFLLPTVIGIALCFIVNSVSLLF